MSKTDEGRLCPLSLQAASEFGADNAASVPGDCSERRRRGTSARASPVSHPGCAGLPHPSPDVTHCLLENIGLINYNPGNNIFKRY